MGNADAIKSARKLADMNFLLVVALSSVAFASPRPDGQRTKKAIGLFTVVNFPNDECQVKSSKDYKGTCFSSSECTEKGGSADGSCGSGFGVCCKFIISGDSNADVTHNCTYVQNDGYPSSITTASKTIDYNVKPLSSNICLMRFDFQAANLGITAATGVCKDKFTVTSPTKVQLPSICGDLAGQHMYVQVGKETSNIKASVATDTATTSRSWNIKIRQIECDNPNKPPSDCTQYYDCGTGTIKSFNFNGGLLPAMQHSYAVCFRPQSGACGVSFSVDSGTTSPNPFCLPSSKKSADGKATSQVTAATTAPCTTAAGSRVGWCDVAALEFPGLEANLDAAFVAKKNHLLPGNFICGTKLNPIDQQTTNNVVFNRGFYFNVVGYTSSDVKGANGFKLNFQQTCQ